MLLFFGSLALGIFISLLDPFLNLWDEQYHALVAKNLIKNPFKPILINETLFAYENSWTDCNIWLHKQPLFLWQMALSLKIFGLNEFAVRFPSVLMHALLVFFIYDIGKITITKNVGYYSALFFTCSYFCLEYLTGFYATDHNDIAFLFYSFLSIWALVRYFYTEKKYFIILVGLFAGLAILNKWLTGLIVYALWFIVIIYLYKSKFNLKEIINFFISLTICVIIFLPWQIYSINNFTEEYALSMQFNNRHITEALEGHGGNIFFYYNALYEQFGEGFFIPPLIIVAFLYMLYKLENKVHKVIILLTVLILYIFFTIVKTKMYGYVMLVIPFFITAIAYCFNSLVEKIIIYFKNKKIVLQIQLLLIFTIIFFLFNSNKIYKHHSKKEYGRHVARVMEKKEKDFYLNLKRNYGEKKCAIFNLNFTLNGHVTGIFYTGYSCYSFVPTLIQIKIIKNVGYKIIIIDDGKLPKFIQEDRSLDKISL